MNRFCASSLGGPHGLPRDQGEEGDAFIAGRHADTVSRSVKGTTDNFPDTENPRFADAKARTEARSQSSEPWTNPRELGLLPDIYIAMGQTAENVAQLEGVTRQVQDEFAVLSQNRAEMAIADGFWTRDITPVVLPDGSLLTADDCPRPGATLEEPARRWSRSSGPTGRHRGQCLPPQRRCRGRRRDV